MSDVDYDAWVQTAQGEVVPQSTARATVERMVALLAPGPGAAVMEIGTGSGFSGAVLSTVVGIQGRVVSLDIDPALVDRARGLHERAGNRTVEVHTADGFAGWAPGAPYDGIIGWTTAHVLPAAWLEQAAPNAVIVAPVTIADVAYANAVVSCSVVEDAPVNAQMHPGGFIEMHNEVITDFGLPLRFVDCAQRDVSGSPWWISATALHHLPVAVAESLLGKVRLALPSNGFISGDRARRDAFTAFVLAATAQPCSSGGPTGLGIGVATPTGAALVQHDGALLAAGDSGAAQELRALRDRWQQLGEPGIRNLAAVLTPTEEGWQVRTKIHI